MVYSQKYCLVQLLAPTNVGDEFASHEWPLHCTIAGVFALDWTDELRREFFNTIANHESFTAVTTETRWFGADKTVKVRLLAMTDELYSLHDSAVSFIERHGGTFNEPLFLGKNFSPHVTMRGDLPAEGETVLFRQLALIDMFPNADHTRRRVISLLPLATNPAP